MRAFFSLTFVFLSMVSTSIWAAVSQTFSLVGVNAGNQAEVESSLQRMTSVDKVVIDYRRGIATVLAAQPLTIEQMRDALGMVEGVIVVAHLKPGELQSRPHEGPPSSATPSSPSP